jgi:hypothetical protein
MVETAMKLWAHHPLTLDGSRNFSIWTSDGAMTAKGLDRLQEWVHEVLRRDVEMRERWRVEDEEEERLATEALAAAFYGTMADLETKA